MTVSPLRWSLAAAALTALLAGCAAAPSETGEPSPSSSPSNSSSSSASAATKEADSAPDPEEQKRMNEQLIKAAWDNDVARARELVEAGADVNHQDDTQQSAYLIAASEGYVDLLDLTLRNGAEINAKDSYDGTALIRAAERGHADVVGRLVQAGIDLDHVNNLGWTALHEAIVLGDDGPDAADTVRVLVAAGVDISIEAGRDGKTALQHAEERGFDAIVSTLRAASSEVADGDAQLLRAASGGDADSAAAALRGGADLEARDGNRRTPLLLAVTDDHLSTARLLVHLGADPDALDGQHDTPWLVTGVTGSVPMAELLLTADPDLTVRNRYGGLSIIPASERGHADYVERVAKTAIDIDHVNDLGWTALLEAVILGEGSDRWQRVVRSLLENGADPSIADRDGVTPLEHARNRGFTEIARIIEQHGG
ncbi:ankyrin repeat domain-containing protein [Nocardioides sp. YR527]|uniref:ankyrin repeat domain-containing protein n=1 Tax=Nocardioides sp. YR527 TaxID=1881028 RepID=UPI000B88B3E5|nr:ankyrin repeat domain-containing protein [Nocardioides sp. YR527]